MYQDGYKNTARGRIDAVVTTDSHDRPRVNQRGEHVGLNDILGKLGGQNGEQGGMSAISKLFGDEGLQGIMTKLQASGLDKQVMSWVGGGENEPVSGAEIKDA